MLISCPECNLQASDKALYCPHCGYPLNPEFIKRKERKKNRKRKRLPNGFGQISEIKGKNLRKPFRAMVSVGKTEFGRPICKLLQPQAFFETYNEAYTALVEHNRNPYTLSEKITIEELYKRWSKKHFSNVAIATQGAYKAAWNYCSSLCDMEVVEIKQHHIKGCINEGTYKGKHPSSMTKRNMKIILDLMLDYAVEYELIEKNYSRLVNLDKEVQKDAYTPKRKHIPFSENEMKLLWSNYHDNKYIQMILIQCYSGWRPGELCLLELKNVDVFNDTFTGGLKTENSKNRTVPIHSKIKEMILLFYENANKYSFKYLFSDLKNGKEVPVSYYKYKGRFLKIVSSLNLNPKHLPHDCRKHFVTTAKKYKLDEYAIKYMAGHSISDITERVYTQREISWLKEEIQKIE